MKDELMEGLVKTFTQGRREVNAGTQILVNAERGEFSTYKELCSVANEMGQPDLIYKFLDLASHHSIWNSRLGAAFSLGSIV
jgi:proteasome component ECM29